MLSTPVVLMWLDCAVCAALAAAAGFRAAELGAQLAGGIVLGCGCGLFGPLAREFLFHGPEGAILLIGQLPVYALEGAAVGAYLPRLFKKNMRKIYIWMDGAGMGLACSLGAMLGMAEGGLNSALLAAGLCGLAPGLLRDVTLGDTAMLVDQPWYASSAIIGTAVTLLLLVGGVVLLSAPDKWHIAEISIILGALATLVLRVWKDAA